MLPESTGMVQLEDLPSKEIFVKLQNKLFRLLDGKIRLYGIEKLAQELKVSKRILSHWLTEGSLIRIDVLFKISKFFNLNFQNNIQFLRGKDGGKIKNPKLPFNFRSEEGARIIAGILGDGGMSSLKTNAYYTNTNTELINGFLKDINNVFGEVNFNSMNYPKKNSILTILTFPPIVHKIFLNLGLKPGKKVESNQGIPKFLFKLNEEAKYAFISQFLDDEGTVNIQAKHLSFTAACLEKHKKSTILHDIEKLLLPLDILCSIYKGKTYPSSRGENRRLWRLQIDGQIQLRKLHEHLDIRSSKKKEKLNKVMGSFKQLAFRKRDILKTYINFMRNIEQYKGHFTSEDLAKESNRSVGTCRNTILRFEKLKLIKCIKSYSSGNYHEFGRYVVI